MTFARQDMGRRGETLAKNYLRKRQYQYVQSNYSTRQGEIDLIMLDGITLVFVEVKTRRSEDFADGESAVTTHKQEHISRTAKAFIKQHGLYEYPVRFDVVVVVIPEQGQVEIRHTKRAFRP